MSSASVVIGALRVKVVVQVIVIDQWDQTLHLYKIPTMLFTAALSL